MNLDTTSKSLEIVLAGAVTSNQLDFVAGYADYDGTAFTPGANDGTSNDTTAVTIVSAPSSGSYRTVKYISIYNNDTSAADLTIQLNNSTTTIIITKISLTAGETLIYVGDEWKVLSTNGSIKSTTLSTSTSDHGSLSGLSDDDHTQYLLASGSRDINNYINFSSEYDNGTLSSNSDIDWSNGQKQKLTLGADITLTFSNLGVGHRQLKIIQDATGSRSLTLPSGLWPDGTAGTFSTAANAVDILSIYYDGSSLYYQLSTNFS